MRKLFYLVLCAALCLAAFLKPASAADESKVQEILTKLNEISAKQQEILTQLEDMKKELYVIKIRATKK